MSCLAGLPVGILMCRMVNREADKNRQGEEAAPTSCYQRFYQLPADCNGSELEEGEERALMLEDAASIESFVGRVSKDYQGEGGGEEREEDGRGEWLPDERRIQVDVSLPLT
ncbi:Chorismate pyruvate-lyase [Dissostichus eleginoides]|uniref:Chorismate pyruvate-lyase n=1 Tax=Dissostichus eleginoides TaxID=100907 RepID=A0AAD9C9Y2_DISEL|nr:Chorismate pyruvate-lyase [Dissostichus eleginoides]